MNLLDIKTVVLHIHALHNLLYIHNMQAHIPGCMALGKKIKEMVYSDKEIE